MISRNRCCEKFPHESFTIKDLGELKYFSGIEVARSAKGIVLSQRKYALDVLKDSGFSGSKPVGFPMELSLNLTANDSIQALSQFMSNPHSTHLQVAERVLRCIKATPCQGLFLKASFDLHLKAYYDSDWGGCIDTRRSVTSFTVFIGDSLIFGNQISNLLARLIPSGNHDAPPSSSSLRPFAPSIKPYLSPPSCPLQSTDPPAPPTPPKPPKKPVSFTFHDETWEDPTAGCPTSVTRWRCATWTSTWNKRRSTPKRLCQIPNVGLARRRLYYRRVEEGKQFPVLCRRLASLNEEFISNKSPSAGFDFVSGRRIEQKLIDYNQEAERFGGYAYEELSEISPDHRFIAYTMYDKDNDYFRLSVRDLNSGSILSKPQADRVSNLAWVKDGKALLYTVTNNNRRHIGKIYCSMLGSDEEDVKLLEESDDNVYVNIRHTKDFRFVTVNKFSITTSKVFLINAADPLSGMTLVWECGGQAHCIVEHHQGCLYLFTDAAKEGQPVDYHYLLCSPVVVSSSPRNWEGAVYLKELNPHFLPLPKYVSQISPGPNYDYYSSIIRFTVSSPVMPDAVVDYDLSTGMWNIIQQKICFMKEHEFYDLLWNDLSEFYACENYDVSSHDGVLVPLTIVYSRKNKKENHSPGILHGHGAYGELLDKRWRGELKSLLDRGWVVAYADVRYVSQQMLVQILDHEIENKLAAWGYSAGGLLVASAINSCPDLFRAALLKVPFLDPTNTLLYPILPLAPADYEEFGYPGDIEDFQAIRKYSPYDNIQKNALYPAVLVSSSFNTRPCVECAPPVKFLDFSPNSIGATVSLIGKSIYGTSSASAIKFGVWEAAKWAARVRECAVYDPKRPVLLNLTTDIVEENRYLQSKEAALEAAFLLKVIGS
ncbi:Protease 2 [Vitis vinifera]|uniref:Prolyl endopeptidase-like n=1 Tax=Vitis vinifera TaxID=29760 RepID=A0A438KQ78_VITVI|nr:Protease 2 [Vitis vinifera]